MALDIITAADEIKVEHLIMMIYGQPDAGKTSMAFTANSTLLIDCDRGAHRSRYRQSCIQPSSWNEISSLARQPELNNYKTIAVDTVGRLLEMLSMHVIAGNGNYGSNGILNLRGYGELRGQFVGWLNTLRDLGKDIVLLAHHKNQTSTEKIGNRYETTKFLRPDIVGSSYDEVMKVCDAVGFLHREGDQRVINFDPTSERAGKNAARIAYHAIPDYETNNQYLSGIIQLIKDNLSGIGREERELTKEIEDFCSRITESIVKHQEAGNPMPLEEINQWLAETNCIEKVAVRSACLPQVGKAARTFGYDWDKENRVFMVKDNQDDERSHSDDAIPATETSETH